MKAYNDGDLNDLENKDQMTTDELHTVSQNLLFFFLGDPTPTES